MSVQESAPKDALYITAFKCFGTYLQTILIIKFTKNITDLEHLQA